MWRIKTTKDGVWLGSWILHSATQFHPFSTLPWDDQYPLHHRAIDQSLREGKNSPPLAQGLRRCRFLYRVCRVWCGADVFLIAGEEFRAPPRLGARPTQS